MMWGFLHDLQAARVSYSEPTANAAFAAMRVAPEITGPGWSQADAVQGVTQLAILRTAITHWNRGPVALFRRDTGALWGYLPVVPRPDKVQALMTEKGLYVQYLMGAPGFYATEWTHKRRDAAGAASAVNYGLALDNLCRRIARAERGPNIPVGFADAVHSVALPVAAVAVLVTGAAMAVIGSVAAWRYFDPPLRRDLATIREAARHYSQRLDVARQTGAMPPPSEIELGAVDAIERNAEEARGPRWASAALVAGGTAAGLTLAGVLSR